MAQQGAFQFQVPDGSAIDGSQKNVSPTGRNQNTFSRRITLFENIAQQNSPNFGKSSPSFRHPLATGDPFDAKCNTDVTTNSPMLREDGSAWNTKSLSAPVTSHSSSPCDDRSKERPKPPPRTTSAVSFDEPKVIISSMAERLAARKPLIDSPKLVITDFGMNATTSSMNPPPVVARQFPKSPSAQARLGISPPTAPPKPPRMVVFEETPATRVRRSPSSNTYEYLADAHSKISFPTTSSILPSKPTMPNRVPVARLDKEQHPLEHDNMIQARSMASDEIAIKKSPKAHAHTRINFVPEGPVTSSGGGASAPRDQNPLEDSSNGWDNKFIRTPWSALRGGVNVGSVQSKEMFLMKKRLNNPTYMYATVRRGDDVISGRPLVRHHSNDNILQLNAQHEKKRAAARGGYRTDYMDVEVRPRVNGMGVVSGTPRGVVQEASHYHDPSEFCLRTDSHSLSEKVKFDGAGYAIPDINTLPQTSTSVSAGQMTPHGQHGPVTPLSQQHGPFGHCGPYGRELSQEEQRRSLVRHIVHENLVKSKVSNAYSVLRFRTVPSETGEAVQLPQIEDDRGSDAEIDMEEHRERLRHVSIVKHKTYQMMSNYERVKLKSNDMRLFEYAMIVGLELSNPHDIHSYTPVIRYCFPAVISDADMYVSNFCFPDADMWQPILQYTSDLFSFVLTNAEGDRKFGWCLRYLPPGNTARLPEAVCVVSPLNETGLYEQLLREVQRYRAISDECGQELLQIAYARPFPAPNKEVYIRTLGLDFKKQTVILKRPAESCRNNVTFELLRARLSVDVLLQVVAAILLERKLIFCSKQLQENISLFEGSPSSLHTFVTVLPSMLIDLVEAPTPFILGIHMSMVPLLAHCQMEQVLVVDLDNSSLLYRVGDEARIIPRKIQRALTDALASTDIDEVATSCGGITRDITDDTVTEAFLRLFVETCGHYSDYICLQQNEEKVFQRELFVKAVSSRSIRMFLEWFTQTQMFEAFITSKLKEDLQTFGLFDRRIEEYRQEMLEATTTFRQNMKTVGKKIFEFFRDSGGKLKKTFKNVYV